MSEASLLPPRQRRVMAPPPRMEATRLFERLGPELTVCLHPERGYMLGDRGGRAVWSHDATETLKPGVEHPDAFRTAACWLTDDEAREHLRPVLTRAEWRVVRFASVVADVAETPDTVGVANLLCSPTALCSIEACHRTLGAFAPTEMHALDPQMRRLSRPKGPSKVSLATVGGAPLGSSAPAQRQNA